VWSMLRLHGVLSLVADDQWQTHVAHTHTVGKQRVGVAEAQCSKGVSSNTKFNSAFHPSGAGVSSNG